MKLKFLGKKEEEKPEKKMNREQVKLRLLEKGMHQALVMVGVHSDSYQTKQLKPKLTKCSTKFNEYPAYRRESDPENLQRYISRKDIYGSEFIGLIVGYDGHSFDFSDLVKALAEVRTDLPEAVSYVFTSFDL
ncbi:hypothetical protein J4474_03620 [Candidatus Pacearchaeota archaeon]|nr:hypothetical protein [Candidatus Pacearchaeota archaeon]